MNATEIRTKKDLPTNPQKLLTYSWNLTLAYQQLKEKYHKLLGSQFGKSSEKLNEQSDLDALQIEMDELMGELAAADSTDENNDTEVVEIPAHKRRRRKHGRNSIPAELITDVVIDLSEEEKKCGNCRKFVDAKKAGRHREYCGKILIKIGQLYRLERFATKKKYTVEQRTELRKTVSRRVLDEIRSMLIDPSFSPLPQSLVGNAINYFMKNWDAAIRYCEWGALPIDNTADERINRPFTIGRNNWIQAGSENGARWMAILYTIITTCKLNNINPEDYLKRS